MIFLQTDLARLVSNLGLLAKHFSCDLQGDQGVELSSVCMSSIFAQPGSLFIATQGAKEHGITFLSEAMKNGAVAVLTDRPGDYQIPALIHPNPRQIAGHIAREIYNTPKHGLFAVTGTNGKTSTTFYLQRILVALGRPTGLLSSAAQIIGDKEMLSELTTPEAPRLHDLLSKMRTAGQPSAAVEVSAQALVRNRIDGLHFDVAGFSNLSRDHLDDFGTMENYLEAKAKLFTSDFAAKAVINVEDQYGHELLEKITINKVGLGVGLDYQAEYVHGTLTISGKQSLSLPFDQGKLMAKNYALALVMLLESGIAPGDLVRASAEVNKQIPGRLERVSPGNPPVFVDYAHTPAGVESAVEELSEKFPELTVVLGASGNRDQGKRPEMARACQKARRLIVTDQHPRDEDPALIRHALMQAARESNIDAIEEPDPTKAIQKAISLAGAGAVLWCGPGQLKYREIQGSKIPFDAIAVARAAVDGA
ncbi:MAG: UDP-N-acetylmuramyl-tripeptide synthetase [Actinobacteria bacterium]|nr:UDP-N-acetylmuramyl-tripeptide synthetase [Actinomycetota bacterium]